MAQRRPIVSHPIFVPLVAVWFAALLGLGVAVLPARLLNPALAEAGLAMLVPLTLAGRLAASGAAALLGGALGLAVALGLARRSRDPRPIYDEPQHADQEAVPTEPVRRPLRVREELGESEGPTTRPLTRMAPLPDEQPPPAHGHETGAYGEIEDIDAMARLAPDPVDHSRGGGMPADSFMILGPQPTHPAHPLGDLDSLLEQFDTALAAFRTGEEGAQMPDPVHSFVARQTGGGPYVPAGGRMPDHQAELRAVLDKLARARRDD